MVMLLQPEKKEREWIHGVGVLTKEEGKKGDGNDGISIRKKEVQK